MLTSLPQSAQTLLMNACSLSATSICSEVSIPVSFEISAVLSV